ncbi:MAG: ATP-binding cassette domain-containing protein [Butyrivibrio sp.]|nr:ATP-binding cassette domain-containing protein [Butyrivibrio sp.]
MSAGTDFIQVENLSKTFIITRKREKGKLFRDKHPVEALRDVSFHVQKGELIGYIGPNGAGKSTTVKILSGIMTPDGGRVLVDGRIPWADRKKHVRHIGVVFGQRMQLWWDVPILDSFQLLRDIYRLPEQAYRDRLEELTQALQLGDLLRTPLRQLSLGQRMRAELCGSLLHRPELLFLDEPTIGLDAVSKLALRDFLRLENEQHGTTILLTTHDMEDIAALCSRVLVLGHGRKLFDGELPELLHRYDTERTITVSYEEPQVAMRLTRDGTLPGEITQTGESLSFSYSLNQIPTTEVLSMLQQAGTIRELTIEPQNIDHLIAAMYREMDL